MTNHMQLLALIPVILLSLNFHAFTADLTLNNNAPTWFYFSPYGGCTEAIVHEINGAKTEILVQA